MPVDYDIENTFCPACEEGMPRVQPLSASYGLVGLQGRVWCMRSEAMIHVATQRLADFIGSSVIVRVDQDARARIAQYELALDSDEFYDGLKSLVMLQETCNLVDNGHLAFVDAAIKRALGVRVL
jgi:hypothetical protein